MEQPGLNQIVDHLFRHESGRLVAVLTRIFGVENIALAEDVVQDSLAEAITDWEYKGVPQNPSGWLFRVARNKALNILQREKYRQKYGADIRYGSRVAQDEAVFDSFFSSAEVQDDQLRMIFTCCHPALSADSQIALALKTLCGFSIPEIARSFLTSEENIKKRLTRARQTIRDNAIPFAVPQGNELARRVDTVLATLYLLFNEGYSATSGEAAIRYDLCAEAIRLAEIVEQHPAIRHRLDVGALLALMYLNASRFTARENADGRLLTMAEQDRRQWDRILISKGITHLRHSGEPSRPSVYQLLAMISAHHCLAPDYASTDWKSILLCYDSLLLLEQSPVVLLNRAIALSMVQGPEEALKQLKTLANDPVFAGYSPFYAVWADLLIQRNHYAAAADALEKAISLSTLEKEKAVLNARWQTCREKIKAGSCPPVSD